MMGARPKDLMAEIRRDLLAEKPVESVLRKLVLLGGDAGSVELSAWASAELRGYAKSDDIPEYRIITAPLQIDGSVPGATIRHQTISSSELPDFAQDEVNEALHLRMGVRELQSMTSQHASDGIVKLQPAGAADLVRYMNATQQMNGRIASLYWSVSTIAIEGVLDQIRTRLAELIAELRSATSPGQTLPTPDQAANAVNVVINGRGNRVNVVQAAHGGTVASAPDQPKPRLTRARLIGAAAVGLATIVGTVVAVLQFAH